MPQLLWAATQICGPIRRRAFDLRTSTDTYPPLGRCDPVCRGLQADALGDGNQCPVTAWRILDGHDTRVLGRHGVLTPGPRILRRRIALPPSGQTWISC